MLRLSTVPALALMMLLSWAAGQLPLWSRANAAVREAAPAAAIAAPRSPAHTVHADTRLLDRDYFVGVWESRNIEFDRDVEIIWTVRNNSTLDYDFIIDGTPYRGSSGTWDFRDGTLYESWLRPDGSTGNGQAAIERIDDNTFRLTVIDNGAAQYRGLVRIYKRRAPPQTVKLAPR